MTFDRIEASLRAAPVVDDCRIVVRRNLDGADEPVAYVVPASGATVADVEACIAVAAGVGAAPLASVLLPMAPLDDSGEWDLSALAALAVLDGHALRRAEQLARQAGAPENVVAIASTRAASAAPLHLSSLLPNWLRPVLSVGSASRASDAPAATSATPRPRASSDGGPLLLPADAPTWLGEMLQRAAAMPAPAGLVVVRDDGREDEIGYAALLDDAQRVLGGLREAGLGSGDHLVLLLRRHDDFLAVFWACILGGIVAVPEAVPPSFGETSGALKRLAGVLEMFERPVLVGDANLLAGLERAKAVAMPAYRTLDVAELRKHSAVPTTNHPRPDDIALMMLTSGSTGRPKGVPLPHRCLIARTIGTVTMNRTPPGVVSLNWMPMNHVAGLLLSHLQDMHLAARQIFVQTDAILRTPLLWLDLLERHRVQFTFAPNFAFGLVAAEAEQMARRRWDLSRLAFIMNGGEAIVAASARRFVSLLAPHGLPADSMVPAWGMSELCSGVTYEHGFRVETTSDRDPHVKVGRPMPGVRLRIVDERGEVLREGQIGQLQIACASLFGGYFGNVPAREETFTTDGWFMTGDLARIDDGNLTITGRDKDVIIINGANHSGPAIEAAVEELAGVARSFTAACGIADPRTAGSEGLALFVVPESDHDRELAELLRAIRQKVVQGFGISPAVIVLLKREEIPKTSIGKIQRSALQKALQQGQYEQALRRVDVLSANEYTLPHWFFRRVWHRRSAGVPAGRDPVPRLVIACPGDPLAAQLAESPATTLAEQGHAFESVGPRRFRLGENLREDLARVVALQVAGGAPPKEVIWLWSADANSGDLAARCVQASQRLIDGVHGLTTHGHAFALAIVTRGAVAVAAGEPSKAEEAAFGALVQTLAQEVRGCHAVHIDIDPEDGAERVAVHIAAELSESNEQREVAWRGDERWVAMLCAMPLAAADRPPAVLRRGGRYVITGGLGGIGVELAAWLLREFEAEVLLLSRASLPSAGDDAPEQRARLAAWQRLAALSPKVAHRAVDVSDSAALRGALAAWEGSDALFHLAGAYHEATLAEESLGSLATVFGPKIGGFEALLAARAPGTPIVCFSSVASLFGGALVGAYAAANRALDIAAAQAGVWSINWSGWHETGLTRRFGAREPLRAMGIVELPPAQALASLQVALAGPAGQWVIGLAAEAPYIARRCVALPLEQDITAFCEGDPASDDRDTRDSSDRFGVAVPLRIRHIAALPRDATGGPDRLSLERIAYHGEAFRAAAGPIEIKLAALWRRVLGVQTISTDASFFELGGQSLLASQLITAIGTEFGVHWSLRDIFEAPTVATQAARLAAGDTVQPEAATHADRSRPQPLGSAQQRLWFLDQVHRGNSAFNIPASIRFAQSPDAERVRRALQTLVDRHESLRTRFPLVDGQPCQVIAAHQTVQLEIDALPAGIGLETLAEAEARTPFDLVAGPLLRARLIDLGPDGAALLLTLHHIIADGWSMKVLFRDWLAAYESDAELPPLAVQYADFAAWQRVHTGSERYARQLAYWQRQLGDHLNGFSLPSDKPRPAVQTHNGSTLRKRLPAALTRRMRALARRQGVTVFVTLLAAYQALLSRYARQHDVVVGTVVANRDRAEFEALIGFIVNVVVLRTDLAGDPRFADILQRVHKGVLDAYSHHGIPFEVLVDVLQPPRDTSRSPLFQVAFDMRDPEITRTQASGVTLGVMEPDLGAAQYDLHLTLEESHDAEPVLTALWQFNTDLFERATIERMAGNFETLLAAGVEQPGQRLSQLDLLSPDELKFLGRWNQRAAPFARDACLHQLFERHVERAPQRLALVHGASTLTYAELEARSNAWAQRLQSLGVGPDVLVAVCLERSIDMVVAMLATLKAGGAFLPLDPAYPQDRLDSMVDDSGVRRLLTDARLAGRFAAAAASGLSVLCMDRPSEALPEASPARPPCAASARSLAYVIYTSGSTGRPKGVLVEHHGWCNVAQAQQDVFGLRPGMRALQFASASFDACAFDLAMALASGGTLVLGSGSELMPGPNLAGLLREQRVEVVTLPPTALAALPDGDYPDLKVITAAGEACPASLLARWARPGVRFFNLYGPTEATIWASYAECFAGDNGAPAIGVPVPNVTLHVLDAQRRPQPVGMPGELYIGGEGVVRGYHGRPELDAERFIPDPFAADAARADARLYRSGDMVRLNASGQLDFLGRSDHQVKVRGFRIEPGEIEAVLRQRAEVAEALVAVRRMADGDDALVAYATPAGGATLDAEALRQHLREALPHYMVPGWIVTLADFPLTPNGKIDRAHLPDPERHAATQAGPVEPPQNELERSIATIWREVLNLPTIDRRQNFFDAGGHSIKMAQVHARLAERLPSAPTLIDLFQHPTIATLAAHVAAITQRRGAPDADEMLPDSARARPDAQRLAALAQRQRAARSQ